MRDFQRPGRSVVISQNGMCATSHPLAAQAAVRILEAGGNAVDAGIAAAMVLNIAEPQSTGLGGDCFALLQPAEGAAMVGLNASGRAPAGLSAKRLRAAGRSEISINSADAVTVPGAVDGFVTLSKDWGRLELAQVFGPAIEAAEQGVPVAPRVAFDWQAQAARLQGTARDFYLVDGQPPSVGQVFRAPEQARVLRAIAKHGRDGFYQGEIAQDMVDTLQSFGGTHTMEDFAATQCDYVTPVTGSYRGHELIELPPNGQGGAAILMANILSHFDLASLDPQSAQRIHLEAEAAKLAYDARDRFFADPAAMGGRLDRLLSPQTAVALAGLIDPQRARQNVAQATGAVHKDTVYLCVVDKDRMALSLIYSVFHSFGSGIAARKSGILLQNRGAGFSLQSGHPNEAAPGKRPMHTIIPGMIRKPGAYLMPFGVMGGQYQANGHMRFLSNIADFGMDPQAAIDAPRSFAFDGVLELETGISSEVGISLAVIGHKLRMASAPLGGAQAIMIDAKNGVLTGGSDPRKDGCAIGY